MSRLFSLEKLDMHQTTTLNLFQTANITINILNDLSDLKIERLWAKITSKSKLKVFIDTFGYLESKRIIDYMLLKSPIE